MDTFPPLYSLDAKNKVRVFHLKVEDDLLIWETGLLDGKLTPHTSRCTSKNKGKKNETTPQQQALKEAESKWKKMIERDGYTENLPSQMPDNPLILPMLLQEFKEDKLKFEIEGCFVQPKIDGIRCLARMIGGQVVLYSRKRNVHKFMSHIKKELFPILSSNPDFILDGELYRHQPNLIQKDKDRFNWITSSASFGRKVSSENEGQIQYHIYDQINKDPFSGRISSLKEIIQESETIRVVETEKIFSLEDVFKFHSLFVEGGYEGLVLRDKNGLYRPDYRSPFVLKVKSFEMDEAIVTGKNLKDGSMDVSTFTWECKFEEGEKKFWITPFGTKEERKEQYLKWNKEGCLLTFKYQGEIDKKNDVPRFAIAVSFRDYE
jgi:ATP-dependent DNA ligase